MLRQCEKQAEKLVSATIDEDYFKELDIFDNYFEQLKQTIENSPSQSVQEDLENLRQNILLFTERLNIHKGLTLEKAKNAGKTGVIKNYGISTGHSGALKIDKRS